MELVEFLIISNIGHHSVVLDVPILSALFKIANLSAHFTVKIAIRFFREGDTVPFVWEDKDDLRLSSAANQRIAQRALSVLRQPRVFLFVLFSFNFFGVLKRCVGNEVLEAFLQNFFPPFDAFTFEFNLLNFLFDKFLQFESLCQFLFS